MTHNSWHVCILIPARDEEKLLPRCLNSLLIAISHLPPAHTVDVVLAVDSSQDNTVQIGRAFLKNKGIVIELNDQQVGNARSKAAEIALLRYTGQLDRCWFANTDADCELPPDWLLQQLQAANKGIQAIAGIVDVDTFEEHDDGVASRFKETYLINKDGTHPHVHGANMGVRADTYLLAGGWSNLKTEEDHDLWNRMRAIQCKMKSDASLRVITSGRRIGRAPHGFAEALAAHNRNKYE